MKVSIIGAAGCVGSSVAFSIATQGLANEMVVTDIKQDWLEHHAIDLFDAAVASNHAINIRMGSQKDLVDSDIVIMAAEAGAVGDVQSPDTAMTSRQRLLPASLKIIKEWVPAINEYCPQAIVIMVTNPAETLTYATYLMSTSKDRSHFIGYSYNDTVRFKIALSEVLGVAPSRVEATVVGEHGGSMVPLFSSVKVDGKPVTMDENTKTKVRNIISDYLPHMMRLKVPRTSGWLSGVGVAKVVRAIIDNSGEVFPCCAVLDGEYGYQGISIGVPAVLGENGVKKIIEYELSPEERELLDESVKNIRKSVDYVLEQVAK